MHFWCKFLDCKKAAGVKVLHYINSGIAVLQAENDGGVHFWIIRYVQPQKVPIKPPKIAILRPNLNKDVPDYSECATVAQYSSF